MRWSAFWCALLLATPAALAQSPRDQALQPDAAYLDGDWAVGDAPRCGDPAGELLSFDDDGTMVARHAGHVLAVGYWALRGTHRLDLTLLTPPGAPERLLDIEVASGTALRVGALTFDVEPDAFRLVAAPGDVMRGADLTRCPRPARPWLARPMQAGRCA